MFLRKLSKYVWGNQMPFHHKTTFWSNEEIRLRSNFMRNRTEKNKILYNKQGNNSVSLLQKSKRRYYEKANIKNLTDHKLFWRAVAPRCSVKKGFLRNFGLKLVNKTKDVDKTWRNILQSGRTAQNRVLVINFYNK